MADRVLTTGTAKQDITQMKQIIEGPLLDLITKLKSLGDELSRPDIWDGQEATKFRGNWETTTRNLKNTHENLVDLRSNIDKINNNIWTAGGGG